MTGAMEANLIDAHVHTRFSHDGISDMEEYMLAARGRGVCEITFTEHWDDYTGMKSDLSAVDVPACYAEYLRMKEKYDAPRINFGIEMGLQPHIAEKVHAVVSSYPFDFVIGSSHITAGKDMAMDSGFFAGRTRHEAYMIYFSEVLENIRVHEDFDVYGHLDYVARYGGYAEKEVRYAEFADILDEILGALIRRGKGLELNTSGLRKGLPFAHPNTEILRRYRELGGEIITLGSDAHCARDLAADFGTAKEMLKAVGFREIAVYHARKPDFVRI